MAPRSVTPQPLPNYLIAIFQTLPPIFIATFLIQIFIHCFPSSTRGKFIFLTPSDSEEIVNLIRRQKSKSTELMNIPVFIYKILAPLIAPTVSMLFNNSLSEGIFSECFKRLKLFLFSNLVTQIRLRIIDLFPCYPSCQKCLKN